jgi:hypothetical protein
MIMKRSAGLEEVNRFDCKTRRAGQSGVFVCHQPYFGHIIVDGTAPFYVAL